MSSGDRRGTILQLLGAEHETRLQVISLLCISVHDLMIISSTSWGSWDL